MINEKLALFAAPQHFRNLTFAAAALAGAAFVSVTSAEAAPQTNVCDGRFFGTSLKKPASKNEALLAICEGRNGISAWTMDSRGKRLRTLNRQQIEAELNRRVVVAPAVKNVAARIKGEVKIASSTQVAPQPVKVLSKPKIQQRREANTGSVTGLRGLREAHRLPFSPQPLPPPTQLRPLEEPKKQPEPPPASPPLAENFGGTALDYPQRQATPPSAPPNPAPASSFMGWLENAAFNSKNLLWGSIALLAVGGIAASWYFRRQIATGYGRMRGNINEFYKRKG
jgi:hypothetical protein